MNVKSLSRVRLLATPWTAAHQAPPSMGFSRQEYWSGVPSPSPKSQSTGLRMRVPRASGAAMHPPPQQKCIPFVSATRPRPVGVSIAQLGSSQEQTSDEHPYPPPGQSHGEARPGSRTATPNLFPRWLLPAHQLRRAPVTANIR